MRSAAGGRATFRPDLPLCVSPPALQHFTSGCNHGNYCGYSCDGKGFTLEPQDELDAACRNHDWCLAEARKLGEADKKCVLCGCDVRLIDAAQEVRTRWRRRRVGGRIPEGRGLGSGEPNQAHQLASTALKPQIDLRGWDEGSYTKQAKEAWSIKEGIIRGGAGGCPEVDGGVLADERCVGIAGELAYPGTADDFSGAPADTVTVGDTVTEGDTAEGDATTTTDDDASSDTSTGAEPSSSCSAGVAADIDLTYGDLPGVEAVDVANWEECCAVCVENDACWAW